MAINPQDYLDGLERELIDVQTNDAKNKDRLSGITSEIDRTRAIIAGTDDLEAAAEAAVTVTVPPVTPAVTPAVPPVTPAVPPAGE